MTHMPHIETQETIVQWNKQSYKDFTYLDVIQRLKNDAEGLHLSLTCWRNGPNKFDPQAPVIDADEKELVEDILIDLANLYITGVALADKWGTTFHEVVNRELDYQRTMLATVQKWTD